MSPGYALWFVSVIVFSGQQQATQAARKHHTVRLLRGSALHPTTNSSKTVPVNNVAQFDDIVNEDAREGATVFTAEGTKDGVELDSDVDMDTTLTGPGSCEAPPGVSCVCTHPQFPCFRWHPRRDRCTCSSIGTAEGCVNVKGFFCERPKECVDNCKMCKTTTFCHECKDGFHMMGGVCQDMGMVFSKAHHGVKGNLVLLGSEEVFHGLEMGFEGTIQRWRAEEYVIKEFFYFYKDIFDFIVVVPEHHLDGRIAYAENFHLEGDRSAESKLRSAVLMQMYGMQVSAIPLLHEMEHEWGVFGDIEKLTPGRLRSVGPHWGMSVMHKRGMLGGFPASAVKCTSGVLGEDSCKQPLLWDFSQGSTKTSHDEIGGYNKFDLLLMGLITAKEMPIEKLIFCEGADKLYGQGEQPVTCKKIHVITAAEIEDARHHEKDERPVKKGETLRAAVVVVMPKPTDVDAELARSDYLHSEDLNWLNKYIADEPARFHAATQGLASIDFNVTSADQKLPPSQADEAESVLDASKDLINQSQRKEERANETLTEVEKAEPAPVPAPEPASEPVPPASTPTTLTATPT